MVEILLRRGRAAYRVQAATGAANGANTERYGAIGGTETDRQRKGPASLVFSRRQPTPDGVVIERESFRPTEFVAIKRALEPVEREAAKERQAAAGGSAPGKLPEAARGSDTRDKLARHTGVSGRARGGGVDQATCQDGAAGEN